MPDIRIALGIPDTLPPQSPRQVWGYLWLGATGMLFAVLSLFPSLVPFPWGGLIVLACWLALPIRGFFSQRVPTAQTEIQARMARQTRVYALIVISFGVCFTLWCMRLGLPWPVVLGALCLIEALPSLIVSLTEWWRVSTVGLSIGLMICGFGFPLVENANRGFALVGLAVFAGGLMSAAILAWQVRVSAVQPGASS